MNFGDAMELLTTHNVRLKQQVVKLETENIELRFELAMIRIKEKYEILEIRQMYERSKQCHS